MASILLIDDDEDVRNVAVAMLLSGGHTVDTANDGKAGLALYKAKLHDLVITDIVMAEMDGLKLIGELRQTEPRPRVIAMSGGHRFSQPVYLPTAKQLGAVRILSKPIRPKLLLQTVAAVLAEPPPNPVHHRSDSDGTPDRNPSKA